MRPSAERDVLVALVTRDYPLTEAMWRSFWDRLRDRVLHPGEAVALVSSLSTRTPDAASVGALLASLRNSHAGSAPPRRATVNIVGTGGGPSTFNLSTAAAFVAATIGAKVIKTGSRAYTSRCGSVDLLDRLGVPLSTSYAQTDAMVESFGIACAGSFVYPRELRLLATNILPWDMRALGRFFNSFGPFLADVPVSAQVTGVSDPALLPIFRYLAGRESGRRMLVCSNNTGVDELLGFEENVIYDSTRDRDVRLTPEALGLGAGSLEDLRPATEDTSIAGHFLALLSGDGAPAAIDSICLNAAALVIACGVADDWPRALRSARQSMERGLPVRLIERIRRHEDRTPHLVGR
ncbi:MAG: anthranilate phosphoribosyltransferase [Pseudonocardiaceae bacterium]